VIVCLCHCVQLIASAPVAPIDYCLRLYTGSALAAIASALPHDKAICAREECGALHVLRRRTPCAREEWGLAFHSKRRSGPDRAQLFVVAVCTESCRAAGLAMAMNKYVRGIRRSGDTRGY